MSIRRLVVLAASVGASACILPMGGGGVHPDVAVPDSFLVRFETTRGGFNVMARTQWSPAGVDRFYQLVNDRYYDETGFFRVVKGFVAQFGLAENPAKTKAWRVRRLADEPVKHGNTRGAISYARGGPGTRTTQIYINLVDNTRNDSQGFSPMGRVVEGMSVVDSLYGGYGENSGSGMRAGKQGPLLNGGNAYIDREFPKLDRLVRIRVDR